jgi:threonylcarbamoyladenosine tRNA methylthiotransferase MtaB
MSEKVRAIDRTNRSRALIELSEIKKVKFYALNTGRKEKVIFESKKTDDKMFGFTSNYLKVETFYKKEYVGKIVEVELSTVNNKGNFEVDLL